MLFPLRIPPGQFGNGTDYQSKGRWQSGLLVRFVNGTVQPERGWVVYSTSTMLGKARALLSWLANDGLPWIGVGTHQKLYVVGGTGGVTDITPLGLAEGFADASDAGGYGTGAFGAGTFGTPRPPDGSLTPATVWSLDTFGETLVGANGDDGKIWAWAPDTSLDATLLSVNAPTGVRSIVTTGEGFLMALGVGADPRVVAWCDQFDTDAWTPGEPSQAGSFAIQTNGKLVAGVKVTGATLIFTDVDVHRAEFLGLPLLYAFNQIGTGCGLIGAGAFAVVGTNTVYWMTDLGFRVYNGEVSELSCDVHDQVFGDFNTTQRSKVTAYHEPAYGEVTFFYPTASGTGENDCYVRFNYREGHWTKGEANEALARLAAVERGGGYSLPFATNDDGDLLQLENGFDYDGFTPYAVTGPTELGDGETSFNVVKIIPDESTLGDVQRTFLVAGYPTGSETPFGPYASANPMDVRFQTKQVKLKIEFTEANDARYGTDRLDLIPAGSRR